MRTEIVNKHDNELFYTDETRMVFGDARKVVEDMVEAVE
jgi:NAD/NADP transhydrogenase beta subunit